MIRKIVNRKFASITSILILLIIIVFHLLVLIGVFPYEIVWGGKLQSKFQMFVFEAISIVINLIIILIILIREKFVRHVTPKVGLIGIWIVFGVFVLNTIGNLFATEDLERYIFTPVTLLLSIFILRLAVKD